jgi:diguanylate cyclase (GGDEF)-like protein/PAS domain S-box-containing protein
MRGKDGGLSFPPLTMSAAASSPEQDSTLQSQLAALIEATPDGIALVNPQGQLRYMNPAGRTMLGLKPAQQLSALSIFDFCPSNVDALLRQEALPTAIQEGRWSAEAELLDGEGRAFPVFLALFAHKEAHAEVSLLSLILRDISEQKRRETELAHLAHHDALTGLFNRRRFQEELDSRLAQVRRYGTQGALLFIDVDGLKTINDTFGHQAGDAVLRDLAALLQTQLREVDIIARLGGDEFAVLISAQDAQHAPAVAARLVEAVRHHVTVVAGHRFHSTISIGIALIPQHGSTSDEVVKHADLALYQAKTEGRNQLRIFTAEMKP